tara:strand:- start:776 stop:1459 length:684 start_codon:yes stop_codon:yes gene_type:complete
MIISIHQPQYIPWLPYFFKIDRSDLFIFLDSVNFQKNGLQNRNEIKTGQGRKWLSIPVNHKAGQKICETTMSGKINWPKKHFQTLKSCYGKSKFFSFYEPYFEFFYTQKWENLSDLNIELTLKMMEWLGITTPTLNSSDMGIKSAASDLVLDICKANGATKYLSGSGGINYLILDDFISAGIEVEFIDNKLPVFYEQLFPKMGFVNDISAVDLIFNCGEGWRDKVIM